MTKHYILSKLTRTSSVNTVILEMTEPFCITVFPNRHDLTYSEVFSRKINQLTEMPSHFFLSTKSLQI